MNSWCNYSAHLWKFAKSAMLLNMSKRHEQYCITSLSFMRTSVQNLFSSPRTVTRNKMLGRYFHAIVTHIRIILHNSMLTFIERREARENIWSIKAASSHPGHVILNIIQRLQVEQTKLIGCKEESTIAEQHSHYQTNEKH